MDVLETLFAKHRHRLHDAVSALEARTFWSAYSETPRAYGAEAPGDGEAAFEALVGKPFGGLSRDPGIRRVGSEVSPYGRALGITYPAPEPGTVVARSAAAADPWAAAALETRTGLALEILDRLNRASFLTAHATMHTTGQAFAMAFQAGGPHAQDRGLEAVACTYDAITRIAPSATWEKPVGRTSVRLRKDFVTVPRGVGLVIGCATFPTWNSYPAIFADLVAGNTVIVKPHPAAILPLAISVEIARAVLAENGVDPDVLQLAADAAARPIAKDLVTDPRVEIVDYTGSSAFGAWLRANTGGKQLFTEEAGLNAIVVQSTDAFDAMCRNIAFSLSLYSGQMCTAPQNIFIPRDGIASDRGHETFDAVVDGIVGAVDDLMADPEKGLGVAGAIQSGDTLDRIGAARRLGRVRRDSAALPVSGRTATPLVVEVDAADDAAYEEERFGPIAFAIRAATADDALDRAASGARRRGAITASLYSTDAAFVERAVGAFSRAAVPLSINLTGPFWVNQSAAFSDFHVSGGNPAGNACLTDAAFVANRFRTIGIRRPAAA